MLLFLAKNFSHLPFVNVFTYTTTRSLFAFFTAFVLSLVFGRPLFKMLYFLFLTASYEVVEVQRIPKLLLLLLFLLFLLWATFFIFDKIVKYLTKRSRCLNR